MAGALAEFSIKCKCPEMTAWTKWQELTPLST